MRRLILFAAAICATMLASCNTQTTPPAPTPVVGVIVAKAEAVPLMTELTGRTMPSETADVRPQVSGLITGRLFTEGSEVTKGQALYQIDARPYAATEAQARAALANAQAIVESTRLKAERYRTLSQTGGISKQDAADADAVWQQSRAQVAAARASLDAARVNLGFTRIVAPISGRIGQSSVTRGALVTSEQVVALAKIQRLDPIWVDIQQSSADFIALRHALETGALTSAGSAPVAIILADGTQWPSTGRLDFADIDVNEMTGTVTLRVTVPNPRGDLLPGLFVKARLTQGVVRNGILLPQAAVSRDPRGAPVVLVVGRGGVIESRNVETSTTFGTNWLITGGLRPGERVVVSGQLTARSGTKVKIAPGATGE
ncbi:efflux RND transporter periplasmic adaptor subunit [Novosphingobium sp.]|uniref:efflux RND transporter periplasmic adaptor subunit n=1 Tax=Novosphingobium sp. TaxID=1874826 RepID=UPI003D11A594